MPAIDMPLDRLKHYMGSSPCPQDIDEFWDRALLEMESVSPYITYEKKEYLSTFADCYSMYFTGVGGARIHAKLVRPKKPKAKHPAVITFHGYARSSGEWFEMLPYAADGFTVAALDCRGQGGQSEDCGGVTGNTLNGHIIRGVECGPEKLLYRFIYLDCAQLAAIVMSMDDVDENRVGCYGGSQGGGLSLACAALAPGIKKVAFRSPFLCDFKRVWDMDLARHAYGDIQEWFRRFDPTHEREEEFFETLGYIDVQNIAHRIHAEAIMFTGLLDNICPPSTQFSAYNKIVSDKSLIVYHDFGHEELPGMKDKIFEFMKTL